MSDDSKSFEKKLDRDFLYYLNLIEGLFKNITEDAEQQLCEVWLSYLVGRAATSVADKCDRNIYLSRLLLYMQIGKLKGIFLEIPPDGNLPCAFTTFGLPTEVEGLKGFEEMGFQIDSSLAGHFADYSESSRDGRTYLATRHLPQGIMAYVAVTNNEGEPAWIPQTYRSNLKKNPPEEEKRLKGYRKKLADCVDETLFAKRKSVLERDKVLEWIDKIIDDCNLWIQGKDPKNVELEMIFQRLYELYKTDREHSELLKHPKSVRTILFKDIRDKMIERRAEVSKREFILDKYEAEQYVEVEETDESLDEVWLECARRPLKDQVRIALESKYPQEVIRRFTELLVRERVMIIQKGERDAKKKISDLRQKSIEDTKEELQIVKKLKNEYKEFHSIYKNIEEKLKELGRNVKEKYVRADTSVGTMQKMMQEREYEIQQAKINVDKAVKAQLDLKEQLAEALESQRQIKEVMAAEEAKFKCQLEQQKIRTNQLQNQIHALRRKMCRLIQKLSEECHC